jgi:hypothetical protein
VVRRGRKRPAPAAPILPHLWARLQGWPPSVDAETPTDLDRSGAVQLALPQLLRIAHHIVLVCRAGAQQPGPSTVATLAATGPLIDALRMAVGMTREAPWSARAWADLSALWKRAGDERQTLACAERAAALDPNRPV